MVTLFFRYALIFAILYLILFVARDQKSTFFLVDYIEFVKYITIACFILTGFFYIIALFSGELNEVSRKRCVRCNKPALKGFVYCHEHLRESTHEFRTSHR
jgi:hypothetical protein